MKKYNSNYKLAKEYDNFKYFEKEYNKLLKKAIQKLEEITNSKDFKKFVTSFFQ